MKKKPKPKPKPKPRPRPSYLLPFVLASLASCVGIPPDVVQTSHDLEEAIAPRYARYVSADKSLSLRDKQTMLRTLELWRKFNADLAAEVSR